MGFSWYNYLYYPVFIVSVLWSGYMFFRYRFYKAYRFFLPFIILSLLFIFSGLSYLFSLDSFIRDEFLKILETYVFLFLLISFILIENRNSYDRFFQLLIKGLIYFSGIMAIIGVFKFFIRLFSYDVEILKILDLYYIGSSLSSDYNFFALCLIFGFILIVFIKYANKDMQIRGLSVLLFFLTLAILLSGSRRAFIILILMLVFVGFHYATIKINLRRNIILPIGFAVLFTSVMYFFYTDSNKQRKITIIEQTGIDPYEYKYMVGSMIYDYQSILKSEGSFSSFLSTYWGVPFNSKRPITYFTNKYKSYHAIPDSLNLPEKTVGYYLDKNTKAYNKKYGAISKTEFVTIHAEKGDRLRASVYCFVSNSFNGSRVFLHGGKDGNTIGFENKNYNLSNKGSWQKLFIQPTVKTEGDVPFYLNVFKKNAKDFDQLEGHVIFALPKASHTVFDPKDPLSGWGIRKHEQIISLIGDNVEIVPKGSIGYKLDKSTDSHHWDGNAYSKSSICSEQVVTSSICHASVYCYVSENFDGEWVRISGKGSFIEDAKAYYDFAEKGTWEKLSFSSQCEKGRVAVYLDVKYPNDTTFKNMNGYVIFAHPEYEIIKASENEGETKPGVEHALQQNSIVHSLLNIPLIDGKSKLASPRIKRWLFAWQIFKDYTIVQKFIGNGFEYLDLYNKKFYPNKDKVDYPHNPVISAFLYSGIIGGLVYVWFLTLTLVYYYRYRKEIGLIFILYLVTGFFVFFSGNSHFSVPAFSMLSVVPFIFRYYKKKIEPHAATQYSDIRQK